LPDLSKQLDIEDEEELEEFLIDAIRAEAINAKIDDLNGQLEITFHQQVLFIYTYAFSVILPLPLFQRVFGSAQWEQLQSRMAILIENLKDFQQNLSTVVANGEA
jgi:hypothetical protein